MPPNTACTPTKYAGAKRPDGWDSARFLGLILSYNRFPFPSFVLASGIPKGITQAVGHPSQAD